MVKKRQPVATNTKAVEATESSPQREDAIASQLAEVLVRLQKLEDRQQGAGERGAGDVEAEKYWLISALQAMHQQEGIKGGSVAYGGDVVTPTGAHYVWQQQRAAREMFKQDWQGLDRVLAALGHPVRLQLLQAILHGKSSKAALEKLEGFGTTGQLYHHLRILEEAGWVRSLERGVYGVPGERVVPLLTMLAAAMG